MDCKDSHSTTVGSAPLELQDWVQHVLTFSGITYCGIFWNKEWGYQNNHYFEGENVIV